MRPLGELLSSAPELTAYLRRHDLLKPLLRRHLIATTVQRVAIPQELRAQLLQQYWQRLKLDTREARQSHLRARALGLRDLCWQLELQPRIEAYAQQQFGGKAEARFLERKNQLDQVVYSLIRVKEAYLAREIYLQVLEGEADFGQLARQYAQGPERETNGVVTSPLGQAHPLLAERLRSAEPGQLLEPMAIAEWWLVVRLDQRIEARLDEATSQRMAVELFQQSIEEQLTDRMAAMQRKAAPEPRP